VILCGRLCQLAKARCWLPEKTGWSLGCSCCNTVGELSKRVEAKLTEMLKSGIIRHARVGCHSFKEVQADCLKRNICKLQVHLSTRFRRSWLGCVTDKNLEEMEGGVGWVCIATPEWNLVGDGFVI
jgi:hypothetical protein